MGRLTARHSDSGLVWYIERPDGKYVDCFDGNQEDSESDLILRAWLAGFRHGTITCWNHMIDTMDPYLEP